MNKYASKKIFMHCMLLFCLFMVGWFLFIAKMQAQSLPPGRYRETCCTYPHDGGINCSYDGITLTCVCLKEGCSIVDLENYCYSAPSNPSCLQQSTIEPASCPNGADIVNSDGKLVCGETSSTTSPHTLR